MEELVKRIGENNLQESQLTEFADELDFLITIEMITPELIITDKGKEYYTKYFVHAEIEESKKILASLIQKHPATQIICQVLWGRQNIKRNNVYNLLKLERLVKPNFSEIDLGSFLMILNYSGIINYSKKNLTVKINYNPKMEVKLPDDIFISPDTPYGNIIALKKLIRECKKFIYWFDKNFGVKGLEVLYDEVDGNNVKKIKILTSLDQNVSKKMKSDFERFKEEMKHRGIETELRIILDKEITREIHDRWLISENSIHNLPPINSIFQNQNAEIKKTTNTPPFDKWWKQGLPLIKEFTKIMNEKVDE